MRDQRKGTRQRPGSAALENGLRRSSGEQPDRSRAAQLRAFVGLIRAWMVLLPVDAALLLAPALWISHQLLPQAAYAALGLLFITGGERFRAKLHLSILDELPSLLGRLLM